MIVVVVSRFCNKSYNGASFLVINEGIRGVRINVRNNVDWEFDEFVLNRRGKEFWSNISGSILIVDWLIGLVAAIAVDGDIIEWSWHSTLISSWSACVSNFGNFLWGFCKCSSLSSKRFKFVVFIVDDVCLVVRRSTIGDGCSRLVEESNKASSELSDKTDCGVRQLGVAKR